MFFQELSSCHKKEFPSSYSPHTPFPHLSLGTVPPDLCIPSIPPLHSLPSPLPPYGKLQGPHRDHRSATRRQDPRNCQTQGGLSVRKDQSLCKPLRHSTPPPLAPCVYNRFVWLEKVMWVKRRKKERGEWKEKNICAR